MDAKFIKSVRERLGESQTAFAKRFSVNQCTISRWEKRGIPDKGITIIAINSVLFDLISNQNVPNNA